MLNRSELSLKPIKANLGESLENNLKLSETKRNSFSNYQNINSTGTILENSSKHRKLVSTLNSLNYSMPNKELHKSSLSTKILNIDTGSSTYNSNLFVSSFYKTENTTEPTLRENLARKKTNKNDFSLDQVKQKINNYQRSITEKIRTHEKSELDRLLN